MAKIFLKKNEEKRVKLGHQWIFSNEIYKVDGTPQNGDIVNVFDCNNNLIGSGFYNSNSLISVRIISNDKIADLEKLFLERLSGAFELRKRIYSNRNSYRLVFSESDFLPGLIIDKYNDTYVLQIYSAGMEKNIEAVTEILKNKFGAKNIFSKHEEYFRKLEGLPTEDKIYLGSMNDEIISDGFINYKINFTSGHKTGFYFDQCDNREFAGKFCKDKIVLDCFCNSGGFGMHAAQNGATSVTFIDSSKSEIENVKTNFELNKLSNQAEFICSDVFDYLVMCKAEKILFDVVMVDPPAFAKSKKSISKAVKGYEKLNRLAIECLKENGILFTSSCSYHLNEDAFIEIINRSALKAGKKIQLLHFNKASMDHPSLPSMEETSYLKFAALKIF